MKKLLLSCIIPLCSYGTTLVHATGNATNNDRKYWTDLCYKMSQPIVK